MSEKNISSRIIHKHDIENNWNKATNFIPKAGEIIVYDRDETYNYERFKIGDGVTTVTALPFGSIQSDWNQNDETAADFVKNRPFYIADEAYIGTLSFTATSNNTMNYTYTAVDYEIFSYFQNLRNTGEVIRVNVGDLSGLMSSTFDRGYFGFSGILSGRMNWNPGRIWTATINDENITLVNGNTYNVVFYDTTTPGPIPIDTKFLPSSVHTNSNAPARRGSGENSVIEGSNTTASVTNAHAEGGNTTASGTNAHAEGGNTTASGENSHAEGSNTQAAGLYSHAEGVGTKASSRYQHVQGKYNVGDTATTYAHIVGNGVNDSTRSNAHTLDWDGNAWFAGDIYTGSASGINKDDGSKKLATEEYVNNAVAGVNAVPSATTDDNDKILMVVNGVPAWMAITNAEGVRY